MILYFTGTGNSRYIARALGELLNDEVVSINDHIKARIPGTFRSQTPFVFVFPTYAWQMPQVVQTFLRSAQFSGCQDAYFALTCGDNVGNAAAYAHKLCKEIDLTFLGLQAVVMPENYIAMFSVPDSAEAQRIVAAVQPTILQMAESIQGRRPFSSVPITVTDRLLSGLVNSLFYPLFVSDKRFRATDACISCGACQRLCPVNDIQLQDGRPVWKGNCTHCMACICGCPTQAIEYGKKSVGQPRYYLE